MLNLKMILGMVFSTIYHKYVLQAYRKQ